MPEGFRTSTAAGTLAIPPADLPLRFAKRRTVMVSEMSDSTALTISPTRAVSAVAARMTRSRDSKRTGNRSTVSNASARRLPGAGPRPREAPLRGTSWLLPRPFDWLLLVAMSSGLVDRSGPGLDVWPIRTTHRHLGRRYLALKAQNWAYLGRLKPGRQSAQACDG